MPMCIGKTTFFVANQSNLEDMPAERLKALEDEHKQVEEANKELAAEMKAASAGKTLAQYTTWAMHARPTCTTNMHVS